MTFNVHGPQYWKHWCSIVFDGVLCLLILLLWQCQVVNFVSPLEVVLYDSVFDLNWPFSATLTFVYNLIPLKCYSVSFLTWVFQSTSYSCHQMSSPNHCLNLLSPYTCGLVPMYHEYRYLSANSNLLYRICSLLSMHSDSYFSSDW